MINLTGVIRFILVSLFFLFLNIGLDAQNEFKHPRGFITQNDVDEIRKKVKHEPYSTWFDKMLESTLKAGQEYNTEDPYETAYLALKQAQMYIVTGNQEWAQKCYLTSENVINDTVYFLNPVSRGLTRATQLFCIAQCYDFCYNAWTPGQRNEVNQKMFQTMLTVNANMGFSANYALESNWNGIRWSSVLLAALVFDNTGSKFKKNPALPFIWDVQRRLQEHISKNIFPDGWNVESLSYHGYNWSFIVPALKALQNSNPTPVFHLENYAPNALPAMHAWSAATVSISHPEGKGIQPDFSDDDPQSSYLMAAVAPAVYPVDQHGAFKWMHDYLLHLDKVDDKRGYLFYSLCWYPGMVAARNPAELGWTTYTGSSYGAVVWRNRFKDENDIVVAFNAPLKRVSGHKGPDNLSFRIIGLGNVWVTGGGRTGEIAGQTAMFVSKPEPGDKSTADIESHSFQTGKEGDTYFAVAGGSCMGVNNHLRRIESRFAGKEGKDSLFIKITDTSQNGRFWRLNTPEFNQVSINDHGFILISPDGSKMTVKAKPGQITGDITVSKIHYGGSTTEHNRGIGFRNQYWKYTKAIDIPCEGNLEVTIVLH